MELIAVNTDQDKAPADDMRGQLREAITAATMSPAVRKRKLLLWAVRQLLLCGLAWYFWDKPWMRWVFWIGVGIAVVNLAMILLMPHFLAAQERRGRAAIERLEAIERESRAGAEGDEDR